MSMALCEAAHRFNTCAFMYVLPNSSSEQPMGSREALSSLRNTKGEQSLALTAIAHLSHLAAHTH